MNTTQLSDVPAVEIPAGEAAPDRLISLKVAAEMLGCTPRTVYNLIEREPTFPRPRKLLNSTKLVLSEVLAYLKGLPPAELKQPAALAA